MKLSLAERMILANQCEILAKLNPKEAESYERFGEAYREGYELDYVPSNVAYDSDVVTHDECCEVMDILSMFDVLKQSCKLIEDKSGIDMDRTEFMGFDGNEEGKQYGYLLFRAKKHEGEFFAEIMPADWNSHIPVLDRYRAMLSRYKAIRARRERNHAPIGYLLTNEEVIEVVKRS